MLYIDMFGVKMVCWILCKCYASMIITHDGWQYFLHISYIHQKLLKPNRFLSTMASSHIQWQTKPSTKPKVPTFNKNYKKFNDFFINLKVTWNNTHNLVHMCKIAYQIVNKTSFYKVKSTTMSYTQYCSKQIFNLQY